MKYNLTSIALFLLFISPMRLAAQWSTDHLSQARDELAACKVGNKLLFAGGLKLNPPGNSKVVDIFDLDTQSWSVDSLSAGRRLMDCVVLGDHAYFVGSSGNEAISRKLDIYDSLTDTWESLDIPSLMYAKSITANGGKVFISGFENVNIYDPETKEWDYHTLPLERNGAAAVSIGTKVIFAGGYNDGANNRLDEVDIYDVYTNTWSVEYLSEGRSSIASVVYDGKAYFAGGVRDDYSVSNKVDIYDSFTDEWSTDSLSVARADLAAAELGGFIYFGGGQSENAESLFKIIDIYNPVTNEWSSMELSLARSGLAAISSGDKIYFAGGWPGSGYVDLIDIFSITTNTDYFEVLGPTIHITPNPVSDFFHIGIREELHGEWAIEVCTLTGQKLFGRTDLTENEILVDASGWPAGLYMSRVKMKNMISGQLVFKR